MWRGTRYILLTDALLRHLTQREIESVFAHEVGHVKSRHMLYYAWFTVCYALVHVAAEDAVAAVLGEGEAVQVTALLSMAAAYWYVVFGFVSRRMEQQADLYAAKTIGSVPTFTSALERIALINGMDPNRRSWRHFSMARRIAFLRAASDDPAVERRFRRTLAVIHLGTLALTLAAGSYVAWSHWPS